jgi:hypothetical protein
MALGMVVPTRFTVQDNMTGPINSIQGKVNKFADAAKGALSRIVPKGGLFGSIAGQVAIGNLVTKGFEKALGAVKKTIASIPEFASRAGEIADTSSKIGIATDALQKYRYAANLSGISNETLNNAFLTLNRNLGTGALETSMGKINSALTAQIMSAPNAEAAFGAIAAAVNAEGDAAKRAAMLNAAFGKSGAQLIPMLGNLENQMKAAEQYGNIIDPRSIATAKIFGDTVARIKTMVQSFGDTIRSGVLRYITPLVMKLQDWIAANRELIRDKIDDFIRRAGEALYNFIGTIKSLAPVIKTIIAHMKTFAISAVSAIKTIIPWVKSAVDFFIKFSPAILAAYTAFTVFSKVTVMINGVSAALALMGTSLTIATGPLGLIAAALAAIGVGIGVVTLKSKMAVAGGAAAAENRYREAARTMVAENEAARIQRERREPVITTSRIVPGTMAENLAFRKKEIERLRNQPRRYQIHSPFVNEFGPLSLDEALQAQAAKWHDEDRFNRATLTGKALTDYLAANPEEITYQEALKRLREDAAKDAAGDGGMDAELKKMLEEIEKYLAQINGGVDALSGSGEGVPGRLNYAAMGKEDFWSIARSGI